MLNSPRQLTVGERTHHNTVLRQLKPLDCSYISRCKTPVYIPVEGFRPKMLAVRTTIGAPKTGLVKKQMFWFFTLIGLTVPYRIWFSRHCDELCVTMVKETTAAGVYPRKPLLPKLWSSRKDEIEEDLFIRNMKDFNFYNEEEGVAEEAKV